MEVCEDSRSTASAYEEVLTVLFSWRKGAELTDNFTLVDDNMRILTDRMNGVRFADEDLEIFLCVTTL
jgi:hypothetical protein